MIKGFHHAALSTPNFERCLNFYKVVLGCEEAWTFGWEAGSTEADEVTGLKDSAARAAMLKLGDTYLEVFEFSSPQQLHRPGARPACDPGITHICLEVEDIHAEYERMKAAGMRLHCPPQAQESGFMTYGRDPDGNIVELLEFSSN